MHVPDDVKKSSYKKAIRKAITERTILSRIGEKTFNRILKRKAK